MKECCGCICDRGGHCDHPGEPHVYCGKHDPADYFGTAVQRACPTCALLRAEATRLREEMATANKFSTLRENMNLKKRLSLAEAVVEAAREWDAKMDKVHEESQYVWTLAHSHGMPYKGATYEVERENLRAALLRLKEKEGG